MQRGRMIKGTSPSTLRAGYNGIEVRLTPFSVDLCKGYGISGYVVRVGVVVRQSIKRICFGGIITDSNILLLGSTRSIIDSPAVVLRTI